MFVKFASIYPPAVHLVSAPAVVTVDSHAYQVPTQERPVEGSALHMTSGLVVHVAVPPAEVVRQLDETMRGALKSFVATANEALPHEA